MAQETARKIFELLQKSENTSGLINYSVNEEIRQLLVAGSPNEKTLHGLSTARHPESGNTLLKQAIVLGNTAAVKLFLKNLVQKETKQIHKYLQSGAAAAAQNADIPIILKSFIAEQRAKHFIIQFVNTYEKKYERMLKKADGDRVPDRENGITSGLKDGINFVSRLAPVSWMGELVRCGAHHAIVAERINRARSLRAAHHVYFGDQEMSNKLPKRLKELLILDGFEIFCCFEDQLVNKISYQEWKKESYDLVVECCDRIKNYIADAYKEEDEEEMNTEGYFSKCFLKGYVKGFRSGKWSKMINNAGVKVKKSDNVCGYYVKCDDSSNPEKWGFRKIFQFEREEFGFDEKYKIMVHFSSPDVNCGILSGSRIHDKVIQNLKFIHGVITQNEVEEDDDDEEIVSCQIPDAETPILYNLRDHVRPFIGREEQCRKLVEWFATPSLPATTTPSQVMVITGSCGVGKTELVRKFANELEKNDKLNIVVLDGRDMEQSFRQFYNSICSNDEFQEEIPIEHVVRVCYRHLKSRRTLLIFLDVGGFNEIDKFVYVSKRIENIKILITSKMVNDWSSSTVLALKAFSEEECERLMSDLWVEKAPIIGTLSRILDFTPLALQQVKAYITKVQSEELNDMNHGQIATKIVTELVESFHGNKNEYTCILKNILEIEVGQDKKSIVSSWQAVFENITKLECGKLAEKIMTALAYMEPMSVGLKKLFTESHHEGHQDNLSKTIELLHKYNIIFPEADTNDQWKMRKIVKKIVRFQHARSNTSEERLDQVIRLMWKWMSRSSEIGSDFPLDLIKHIQFSWSYAVHYSKLVEKYIFNFDYSRGPVNSFLHILLRNDRYNCVDKLLDHLASFDGNDNYFKRKNLIVQSKMMANGRTPLHLSVQIVNTAVRLKAVKLFIKWGGLVGATDSKNDTPLHLAAEMGHTDVVRIFLEENQVNGDLVLKINDALKSPLDLAQDNGRDDIIGVIRDYQNDSRKSFKDVVETAMEKLGNNGVDRFAIKLNGRNV